MDAQYKERHTRTYGHEFYFPTIPRARRGQKKQRGRGRVAKFRKLLQKALARVDDLPPPQQESLRSLDVDDVVSRLNNDLARHRGVKDPLVLRFESFLVMCRIPYHKKTPFGDLTRTR